MNNLTIRTVNFNTDMPDILIMDRYINGERMYGLVMHEYKNYKGMIYVAEINGEIAGYVSFLQHHLHHVAMIDHMAVKEHHRRKGIGTQLIKHVTQEATKKHNRILAVQIALWNYAAIQFYKVNGFTMRAVLPGISGTNSDMIGLDKDLIQENPV